MAIQSWLTTAWALVLDYLKLKTAWDCESASTVGFYWPYTYYNAVKALIICAAKLHYCNMIWLQWILCHVSTVSFLWSIVIENYTHLDTLIRCIWPHKKDPYRDVINALRMHKRVTVLTLCVRVFVCVCVKSLLTSFRLYMTKWTYLPRFR